ncbi:MAG: hypothetical protein HY327_00240 [Chloroflexi bacterium]|nr:hypothetical protein [Chloroflexota bacterium]
MKKLERNLQKIRRAISQVLYGMALHDIARDNLRRRGSLEHLFLLTVFGDLVGLPIIPPYYSMRLLPFIVPEINNWRRRLLREKDYLDAIF